MVQIWRRNEEANWKPVALEWGPLALDGGKVGGGVWVCRSKDTGASQVWVLICGHGRAVRVNGLLLGTGIRVLTDRDEIQVDSNEPVFFSTETLARVETFEAGKEEMLCPRCKRPLEHNTPVVRCPRCKLAYHHSTDEGRDCWGYSPTCTCGHPTAMDAGFRWTPDEMWE